MNNYNLDEENNKHPFQYYGNVKEVQQGDSKFLLKSALSYVVDDYDEYLGSVEQSHYEDLGYYEVKNFNVPTGVDTLDLTWMDSDDIFDLDENEQIPFIRNLIVNIDNLGYSNLPKSAEQLALTVNGNNTKLSIVSQIKAFKDFVTKNRSKLTAIQLRGFSQLMESLLAIYAKRSGIEVLKEEDVPRMHI